MLNLYKKFMAVIGLLALAAISQPLFAATAVSWTSPVDGSSYDVGTLVAPTGNASGIGATGDGLDLALVLDSSGSMGSYSTSGGVSKTRQQWQRDAAIALVNNLPTANVSVTIIEFDSNAGVVTGLTPLLTNTADIIAAINSVDASGGTYIGTGIRAATGQLTGANHIAGRSQQMVVFSDGSTSGIPANDARDALTAGVEAVHSVALPGANISTMQSIAASGNGTFVNATVDGGLQDLINLFSGAGGTLVGIDHVDIVTPDGTLVGSVAVDAFGNFTAPNWLTELGENTFTAIAYGTDGTSASAGLTLYGTDGGNTTVPEPGFLGLMGLGLIGLVGIRRRKA